MQCDAGRHTGNRRVEHFEPRRVLTRRKPAFEHGAAHIAYPDHADRKGRHRFGHDCTSRLDLAIDINMPSANPKVTILCWNLA